MFQTHVNQVATRAGSGLGPARGPSGQTGFGPGFGLGPKLFGPGSGLENWARLAFGPGSGKPLARPEPGPGPSPNQAQSLSPPGPQCGAAEDDRCFLHFDDPERSRSPITRP